MKNRWFSSLAVALSLASLPLQANELLRKDNLKTLLQEVFSDNLLQALAQQAIDTLERTIAPDLLVAKFLEEMPNEPVWGQLAKPYDLFSDDEIADLAAMFTSPLYKKFTTEGTSSMMENYQTIQTVFSNLAQTAEEAAPVLKKEEASSSIIEVTKDNFASVVENSSMPIIIDVYATWCPPCKKLSPILEKAAESNPSIRFVKINVDDEQELAIRYHVRSLPTLLFLLPGKSEPSMNSVGLLSERALDEKIAEFKKLF